jgi:hypothetical protein
VAGNRDDRVYRGLGQERPSQIGVEDGAGSVDDPHQPWLPPLREAPFDPRHNRFFVQVGRTQGIAAADFRTEPYEHLPALPCNIFATECREPYIRSRMLQHAVYGREVAEERSPGHHQEAGTLSADFQPAA